MNNKVLFKWLFNNSVKVIILNVLLTMTYLLILGIPVDENERRGEAVISSSFYVVAIALACLAITLLASLPIYFNLFLKVKGNMLLRFLSFLLIPIVFIGFYLFKIRNDISIVAITSIVSYLSLWCCFYSRFCTFLQRKTSPITTPPITNNKYLRLLPLMFSMASCYSFCDNMSPGWHSRHMVNEFYFEGGYEYGEDKPRFNYIDEGARQCDGYSDIYAPIEGGIFAVGYDSSFIIAKLHPFMWEAIEKRLSVDTNARGDYSIPDIKDSIYFLHDNDSIYKEGNKWYHKNKPWATPYQYEGVLDKTKTDYYILDIRHRDSNGGYNQALAYPQPRKLDNLDSFMIIRKQMGVNEKLDFTIFDDEVK